MVVGDNGSRILDLADANTVCFSNQQHVLVLKSLISGESYEPADLA